MSNVAFTAEVKKRRPQPYSGPMCTRVQWLKAAKTLVLINEPYILCSIKRAKKENVNLERKKTKAGRENMDRPGGGHSVAHGLLLPCAATRQHCQ